MKQASMERKILSYSISLALCLLMFLPLRAQNGNPTVPPQGAPPKKEKKDAKEEVHYPLYNGMSVGLDLWGIGSSVFGGDFLSSEVSVDVNLKNRFFPIAELGYGSTDTWSDKGIHYKSNAPYFRIGMDYNTLYKKQHGHMLLVGLRYGVSSFKYDVDALGLDDPIYGGIVGNPNLDDEIWGGSLPYNHKGMKGSMQWAEFCVGIRAHVWKALYMGWSLRFKFKLSASADEYGDPWYVPGFGKYGSNTMGVTYTITYKLPLSATYDRVRDLATGRRTCDGLFRRFYSQRNYIETRPAAPYAGDGHQLRLFPGFDASAGMDRRQFFQPPDRKY